MLFHDAAIAAETAAWRAYRNYVARRSKGNRGATTTFLGDDQSRELWRAWIVRRKPLLNHWRRRRRRDAAA